ncbi:MAG TPA: hypothetical protein VGM15_08085 [Burkholderiaceae bacterium]
MRTHLEFRSDDFPPQPGEQDEVNPGRWGKLLASYLRTELSARGLGGASPIAEDWGFCIPIENSEFPLWVGCGNYEQYPNGFLCFIEPRKPFVRKLLRKIDTTTRVEEVATALESALRAHGGVRDLRWWTEEEAGA